ncbi:MAG: hypothetical protein FWH25_04760 [Syntrophorhabdaceae bacterium]|nr:hypothetical protein [Syntrophorhabdaceae bacterium]
MLDFSNLKEKIQKTPRMTVVGMAILFVAMIALFASPESLNGAFEAMVEKAYPIVVNTGLLSTLGVSIVIGVIMGRILERLGLTDALMQIFLPIGKLLNINASALVPCVYNLLGDVNAASRISAPVLVKCGATNDEKKLAIFTVVQAMQSFSTFMLGLGALTLAGVRVGLVILLSIFAPMIVCPLIGRALFYKDCKAVEIEDLPIFTPDKPFINTLFNAGQEGMQVLLFLILPAFAVVYSVIGLLSYIGVWAPFEAGVTAILVFMNIDPVTGIQSIMASPTLAAANLKEAAASMDPEMVIGSFVLAASGFPLSIIFGQLPMIWSEGCEMKASEVIRTALLGVTFRLFTAGFFATVLARFLI